MSDENIPEHLSGINDIREKILVFKPNAEEYADIAFALAKIESGDKESLEKVTKYIQRNYRDSKAKHQLFVEINSNIETWIGWATNFTKRK